MALRGNEVVNQTALGEPDGTGIAASDGDLCQENLVIGFEAGITDCTDADGNHSLP